LINSFARQLGGLLAERSAPIAPGVFDGLATQTELVNQVALLSRCLDIPLVADADTGASRAPCGQRWPARPAATSHRTTRTPRRRSSLLLASTSGRTLVAEQFNSLFYRSGIFPSSKLTAGCARAPNTERHPRSGRYPDEH
jgi:hypothetical protein